MVPSQGHDMDPEECYHLICSYRDAVLLKYSCGSRGRPGVAQVLLAIPSHQSRLNSDPLPLSLANPARRTEKIGDERTSRY
jgi:hypothetical protein